MPFVHASFGESCFRSVSWARRDEVSCPGRGAACNAAPQSRDPATAMDPGLAAHHAVRHSASKTRVNALVALRSIRGTSLTHLKPRSTLLGGRLDAFPDLGATH